MAEGDSDYEQKRDFNRDLDSYISSRKKRSFSLKSIFGSKPKPKLDLHPDVQAYGNHKEEPAKAVAEDSALEEEYKKESAKAERGILSRIFGSSKPKPESVEPQFDEHGNITHQPKEEVKEEEIKKEFKEYEADEMLGEKPAEEGKGVFSSISSFLGLKPKISDYSEEEVIGGQPQGSEPIERAGTVSKSNVASSASGEQVKTDMREIAKISTDILRKLDPKTLEEFKKTAEFEKFKEILRKNKMIKEK
jgi:hypothetical protein